MSKSLLPQAMNFVEYRPSMVGIPVQSVGRYYDRLDKMALRADAESSAVLKTLGKQMAIAAPGDVPYLTDLYNKLDGVVQQASTEKNLPGYSQQIAKLVREVNADPKFAHVQNQGRLIEEQRKIHQQLVAQHGAENVQRYGDDPATFTSFAPDGSLQQFMGYSSKRPDYLVGLDQTFMKNADIVNSLETLDAFIQSGDARTAYMQTNEGRMHLEEISKQLGYGTFHRADPVQQRKVQDEMDKILRAAGVRYINTPATNAATAERDKRIAGQGIYSSGVYGQSVSGGDDNTDMTIAYYDDDDENSRLDKQLRALFKFDRELETYDFNKKDGKMIKRETGQGFSLDDIEDVFLTSAYLEDGTPMVGVKYQVGEGTSKTMDTALVPLRGQDLGMVQEVMGDTFAKLVSSNTTEANRLNFIPTLVNLYESDFNRWQASDENIYTAESVGVTIKRTADGFRMFDSNGKQIADQQTGRDAFYSDVQSARNALGKIIMNTVTPPTD